MAPVWNDTVYSSTGNVALIRGGALIYGTACGLFDTVVNNDIGSSTDVYHGFRSNDATWSSTGTRGLIRGGVNSIGALDGLFTFSIDVPDSYSVAGCGFYMAMMQLGVVQVLASFIVVVLAQKEQV